MATAKPERIAKVIAASGLCSRREAERWIEAGRVTLAGQTLTTPATLVTNTAPILVDGAPLSTTAPQILFAYHKPTGELVTEHDPQGRRTIYDSLNSLKKPTKARLIPVGRLDLNSEGLLLLSTSPALVTQLMHGDLERVYRVRTFGQLSPQQEQLIIKGLMVEGIQFAPAKIKLERAKGRNCWYELTLTEGKNREIRRIFEHFDVQVNRLIRTAYGPYQLGNLPATNLQAIPLQA